MKYFEVKRGDDGFADLDLTRVLLALKPYGEELIWSMQILEAAGNIEDVVGCTMLELESKIDSSMYGLLLPFEALVEFSSACDDIVDVLLVGCKDRDRIPAAFKEMEWDSLCDVVVYREDSSLWQLGARTEEIIRIFRRILDR